MSKSNALENDLLTYIFNNTTPPWASDAGYYMALHAADPGETGNQSSNELTTGQYTGYARVLIARNSTALPVTGDTVRNGAQVQFPTCTGGSGVTATHWSIGRLSSGAGQILYKGALTSSLAISNNITPQFAASALGITED
jgi:hypothetical protein